MVSGTWRPRTVTIFMPPDADTVELPTDALNEVDGQSLVFVQPDPKKTDYVLRRVAVVRRFKDVTFIRSVLTEQEKKTSAAEVQLGRRPMQPLRPGERALTGGIVQMASALESLVTKERVERQNDK